MIVGDRVQVGRDLATVRYVGYIKEWGNTTALGIEWDDASRGKNDGETGGIRYFYTSKPGAGSFIKMNNRKLTPRIPFDDAVVLSYGVKNNEIHDTITLGTKVVENYGFDKLNKLNASFNHLVSMTLDFKGIYKAPGTRYSFAGLKRLDLSFNLFRDIDEIWKIIDHIPHLNELNLNGNRFDTFVNGASHGLEVLKLSATKISIEDLSSFVLPKFPGLKELTLASNDYTDEVNFEVLNLDYLDLSFNGFQRIPLANAADLNVSDNYIDDIYTTDYCYKSIDLRNNKIENWDFFEKMNEYFNLQKLNISENPIVKGLEYDDTLVSIVGRLLLSELNGSPISLEELENAEMYFVSKVNSGDFQVDKTSKRWIELAGKYNATPVERRLNDFAYEKMEIHVVDVFKRWYLKTNSVLKIKGAVGKELGLLILNFNLWYPFNNERRYLDEVKRLEDYDIKELYVEKI